MASRTVEVPASLLALLGESRLGRGTESEQVRLALAVLLFQAGEISAGRAAELAGQPRGAFELLLGEMGVPPVSYDEAMNEEDLRGLAEAERADDRS